MADNHGLADKLRSRIETPEEKANLQARNREYNLEYDIRQIMGGIRRETMYCKNRRKLTYKYPLDNYKFRDDWKPVGGNNARYTALRELIIQRLNDEGFHNISVSKHVGLIDGMQMIIKISW